MKCFVIYVTRILHSIQNSSRMKPLLNCITVYIFSVLVILNRLPLFLDYAQHCIRGNPGRQNTEKIEQASSDIKVPSMRISPY